MRRVFITYCFNCCLVSTMALTYLSLLFFRSKENLATNKILVSDSTTNIMCDSCLCNKSYKLSFTNSSFKCDKPFQVVDSNVQSSALVNSFRRFRCYVIFIDYFTKYTWLYPLKLKICVFPIFVKFSKLNENYFHTKIKPYTQMVVASTKLFLTFQPNKESNTSLLYLIHLNTSALPNANIAILQKLD